MALALPPSLSMLLARLRGPRAVTLVLALLLLLRRLASRRARGRLEQRALQRQLIAASTHSSPDAVNLAVKEQWHDLGDGTRFASLAFTPSTPSDLLICISPGNPGLPHYYLPLLRALVAHHGGRHEVRILAHTGHYMPHACGPHQGDSDGDGDRRVFDLQEQVAHKVTYLQQRLAAQPTLRLAFIGHSIGSFLVLQLAAAFPTHVAKLVLMQPTIHEMAQTPQARKLAPLLLGRPWLVPRVVQLLEAALPLRLRQWLVARAIGADAAQDSVLHLISVALIHDQVLRNVVHMAGQELRDVKHVDAETHQLSATIARHEEDTLFVYSPVDGWVPGAYAQHFQLAFPRAGHRLVPQGHAFMMERHGSRDMAAHITRWLDGADSSGGGRQGQGSVGAA